MPYVVRRRRDSVSVLPPLLFAVGSLGVLALFWRRRAAPRVERRRAGGHAADGRHDTGAQPPGRRAQPAPVMADASNAQLASSGTGALIHRRYEIIIPVRGLRPADLMRLMQRHLTELAPSALADFTKAAGSENAFRTGDEYDITMLGPWNGRVRVCEISDSAFTLVTLDGHPEAGHITFSAGPVSGAEESVLVLIESWARARDAVVHAAYSTIRIGKKVQAEVWITFLQRLAALAGVTDTPQVRIITDELPATQTAAAPGSDVS